jgi:hypothetical protein
LCQLRWRCLGRPQSHGPQLLADEPITTIEGVAAVIQKRPIGVRLGIQPVAGRKLFTHAEW